MAQSKRPGPQQTAGQAPAKGPGRATGGGQKREEDAARGRCRAAASVLAHDRSPGSSRVTDGLGELAGGSGPSDPEEQVWLGVPGVKRHGPGAWKGARAEAVAGCC